MEKKIKIGWRTATAIVVANMIGTGIFTSLGFQLVSTKNTISILLLWALGAIMALCGAFSYAELGTRLKRSGGEYHFLSKAYNPLIGYLSGWVSLTVGFSAPVALAAMAMGEYVGNYFHTSPTLIAVVVVILVSLFHSISIHTSSKLQNTTTILKVLLVLVFIVAGFIIRPESSGFILDETWKSEIIMPAFAISFVYVTYSYLGWNAAAYIVDEIKDIKNNLPKALVIGTLIVSCVYLLLNLVFLYQSPVENLVGELEVGQLVAINMFGEWGGILISMAIAFMLISSISAMIWTGPRVTQVMAEDHSLWSWFAKKSKSNIPLRSIGLQSIITLIFVITGTFEQVLLYSGFILQLFGALTIGAVFIIRKKERKREKGSDGFKSPLYPAPQIIFLLLSIWVLIFLLYKQPLETGFGLANLAFGIALFYFGKRKQKTS